MTDAARPLVIPAFALGAIFLAGLTTPSSAETNIEPARIHEIAALLPPKPAGLGRPITDRAAWEKLAATSAFAQVIANAEKLSREPVPELTDALYLDYSKTGNRDRCQRVLSASQPYGSQPARRIRTRSI